MINIEEILKTNNVTVTDEQKAAIVKAVKENYNAVNEFDKKVEKLEAERDGYKEQFETATETLKGFDGIKPDELQAEVAKYKKAAEEKEKEFNLCIWRWCNRVYQLWSKEALFYVNR